MGRYLPRRPVTRIRRARWEREAQQGEFGFHATNGWRRTPDFARQSDLLFRHFGFEPDSFCGKVVIDLGAGSKLRTRFFVGSTLIAIEPLADRFLRELGWCDLRDAAEVYSVPAEERLERCVGRADLIVSMNVLDHCYDFEAVVQNIRSYLRADGLAFLSFDEHERADAMHPLELNEAVCRRVFARQGLRVERSSRGFGGALETDTYGHGRYCLNYWLRGDASATAG